MDLDGTLTQHKTPLIKEHREILFELSKKYKLLMVGAGQVMRIFNQLEQFPLDIIGNYGMQYGVYNEETKTIDIVRDITEICDKQKITDKINAKPKPIFLRLPNKPTKTSSRICPESNPKSKILENIVIFVKNYLSFATVECSERKLFACAVGEVELAELLLCGRTEHLMYECAGDGR